MTTTVLLLLLMILITGAAFVLGIALSYWIICGILDVFHPARIPKKTASSAVLAPTHGGD